MPLISDIRLEKKKIIEIKSLINLRIMSGDEALLDEKELMSYMGTHIILEIIIIYII